MGQELPGRVVIRESLKPFNDKDPSRDLKIAGDTGVVCKVNGQPIYRKTIYTDVAAVEEVQIAHDNIDEIRAANRVVTNSKALKPQGDFDL
jgi:L-ascorbate metabolism protein UlaG (beta-lactamase superfamily)